MLVLQEVFAKPWSDYPPVGHEVTDRSELPAAEFWQEAIGAIRRTFPDFLFMAEVYWGLESRLQQLGFDFTYDKRLYDHLVARNALAVQTHLLYASEQFVDRGVHFLENHDEARVAALLTTDEHQAAAAVIVGLPGMCLLHEGQLTGARQRLSVHLGRRILELEQSGIAMFYAKLLKVIQRTAVRRGKAFLLRPREAWAGNPTAVNFVIVQWQSMSESFDLIVTNLADHRSQCIVDLNGEAIGRYQWQMKDILGTEEFVREGQELGERGLFLDVPAQSVQLFRFAGRS